MNAITPFNDFKPAYWQLQPIERKFVDGYVSDIEGIAEKAGIRIQAALQQPFPYELDQRALALLASPLVRAAVAERVRELADLYDVSINRTLREITAVAYANINNYIEIDPISGVPEINLSKCTVEQLSAVKMFEIEDKLRGGRKYKFQLHDKLSALNMVARYQGILSDDNEHWQQAERSVKPVKDATIPANATDDQAAEMYSREINR